MIESTHHRRLWFRKWSRTLHIYLSMLGLVLMVFFALTGFMLNHSEWFGLDRARTRTVEGALPAGLLTGPDKLAVVEKLRADFGARGAMDSFDVQEDELRIAFKSPGRKVEAVIHRGNGTTPTPYICAVIELEEGVLFTSTLHGVEEGDVRIGMAVEVNFEQPSGTDFFLPVFRPATQ